MALSEYLRVRDGDVISEKFEAELVILDLKSGKYYSLSPGAAAVWHALLEGSSVDDVVAMSKADIRRVIGVFVDNGLMVLADAPKLPVTPTPSIIDDTLDFDVPVFDDLADLLAADPIHDVDEQAGWPHRPPTKA